jgi:hypothetical protein
MREYSWKSGPQPPMMAQPLGAFIHFLKEPSHQMALHAAQFALTENSFRLAATDPLAGLRDLSQVLYEAVTVRNGRVYCHSLRGLGSRSHHGVAVTGAAHGGEAMALESYPPEVWRGFIFEQVNVAKKSAHHLTWCLKKSGSHFSTWSIGHASRWVKRNER